MSGQADSAVGNPAASNIGRVMCGLVRNWLSFAMVKRRHPLVVIALAALACAGCGAPAGQVIAIQPGAAGNPEGHCQIPSEALPEDSSKPLTVIGSGTQASCTGQAVIDAVAQGGVI